jgi:hypothetical protein
VYYHAVLELTVLDVVYPLGDVLLQKHSVMLNSTTDQLRKVFFSNDIRFNL